MFENTCRISWDGDGKNLHARVENLRPQAGKVDLFSLKDRAGISAFL